MISIDQSIRESISYPGYRIYHLGPRCGQGRVMNLAFPLPKCWWAEWPALSRFQASHMADRQEVSIGQQASG